PLTQTYSRAGIETILKNIERNPKGNSLVIIDIDEFKKVNDLYGHQVGDEFLRFFVEELRKRLRSSDKIIRFGGDEFLILMENCDLSDAVKKMEFASEDIKKTKFFVRESNVLLPVSFSYGISYIQSKDQFDKAVSKADKKLYEMKIYKKHLMNREQSDEV
ncbi:MAG TPA: GGDEF domain-containing protein, partial [Thermotogaceae bacterium]|nr:GGDEF domain-containing protein [Thermotogaceae bacterium]